jgi:hypothetical protein
MKAFYVIEADSSKLVIVDYQLMKKSNSILMTKLLILASNLVTGNGKVRKWTRHESIKYFKKIRGHRLHGVNTSVSSDCKFVIKLPVPNLF